MSGVHDDLATLRQIAKAADNGSPWEWKHAYPQRVTRVGDVVLVADCFEDPDSPSRFAEFIAMFDPPTVLSLLEQIEWCAAVNKELLPYQERAVAAEAEVARLRDGLRQARNELVRIGQGRSKEIVELLDGLLAEDGAAHAPVEDHDLEREPNDGFGGAA